MSRGHSKPPPSLDAFQASWDLGGYRGHVPARVTGRIPPGTGDHSGPHQARSQRPGVARRPRLVSQTPARPAFRYLPPSFHPFLPAESSRPAPGSALMLAAGERESRRAGGLPGSRASRAQGSAPSLRPGGLRAFNPADSTGAPWTPPRTPRLSPPHTRTLSKAPSQVDTPGALSQGAANWREGDSA